MTRIILSWICSNTLYPNHYVHVDAKIELLQRFSNFRIFSVMSGNRTFENHVHLAGLGSITCSLRYLYL